MNIQIFGTKKCNDTKKAERFFKERGIKYQFIDMKEKGRQVPVAPVQRGPKREPRRCLRASLHLLLRQMVVLRI